MRDTRQPTDGNGQTAIESPVGSQTLIGGTGCPLFEIVASGQRNVVIGGFDGSRDYVQLRGYAAGDGPAALKTAATVVGSEALTLSDGSQSPLRGSPTSRTACSRRKPLNDIRRRETTYVDRTWAFRGTSEWSGGRQCSPSRPRRRNSPDLFWPERLSTDPPTTRSSHGGACPTMFRLMLVLVFLAVVSFPLSASAQIDGAGSVLAAPIFVQWGSAARVATGVTLQYLALGSEGGQSKVIDRNIDFAVSDMAIDPGRLATARLMQFPMTVAAAVPIVNLPGVTDAKLRITGELLAKIYLGEIRRWNDPDIAEANRGIRLPDVAIVPIFQVDGSVTTMAFTAYMSAVSHEWMEKVGSSNSVQWPVGRGAVGNDGVIAAVQQNRGGIGYVASGAVARHSLTTVALRNKSGHYASPGLDSYRAAVAQADWPHAQNYAVNLIDLAGPDVWPIMSATYVLVPRTPSHPERGRDLSAFFQWAFNSGGSIAADLGSVLVPPNVRDSIRASWRGAIGSKSE